MRWLLFIVLLIPAASQAADLTAKGKLTDTGRLEIAYQAVAAIDWIQTQYIAENPESYSESNPVLGRHPSPQRVNAWFVLSGITHAVITHALPKKWDRRWQYVTIAIEAGLVAHNHSIGIGVRVPL